MGIVYLLQPPEFVGTTRYKIGCSKKNDLSRVRYYGKETWYILIMHCDNPYDIETELIKEFNINFKNIAKREWFEGNIDEMVKLFIEIFLKNKEPNEHTTYNIKKDIIQSDNSEYIEQSEDDILDLEEITDIFINWKNDRAFGGEQYLIKFIIEDWCIKILTLCAENKNIIEYMIDTRYDDYLKEYFNKLIEYRIIKHNTVYDLFNKKFIKSINKFKKKKNIILSDTTLQKMENKNTNSHNPELLFGNNLILNNTYYVCEIKSVDLKTSYIYIGNYGLSIQITYIKLFQTWYEKKYLYKFVPYLIEENDNNEYYILNRRYEYIGLNTKYIEHNTDKSWKQEYMYNSVPWENIKSFKQYIDTFKKLTKHKTCLNMNENFDGLMKLCIFIEPTDNTICQKPQEKQHHHSVMFMINMYCKFNENERNLFICPGNLLYNQYTKWCTTYNIKEPMTITMFGLKIPKYNGVIKKRTRSGIVYRIQFNELRNSFEKNDMWKTSKEE